MDIERHQEEVKVVIEALQPRLAALHNFLFVEPVSYPHFYLPCIDFVLLDSKSSMLCSLASITCG